MTTRTTDQILDDLQRDGLITLVTLPDHDVVFAYVAEHEPIDAQSVATGLDVPWESRTTVRNRLDDLVADGRLIVDADRRPMLFAVNGLDDNDGNGWRCGNCGTVYATESERDECEYAHASDVKASGPPEPWKVTLRLHAPNGTAVHVAVEVPADTIGEAYLLAEALLWDLIDDADVLAGVARVECWR